MFSGSWILRELGVSLYVRDATPIIPPEPLGDLDNPEPTKVRAAVSRLRLLISLSTALSWLRKLGFRVFVHEYALNDPLSDFVRAAAGGAVDGVVAESGNEELAALGVVNTKERPMYKVIHAAEVGGVHVDDAYGVIIMDPPLDPRWLMEIRGRLNVNEVFIGVTLGWFRLRLLKDIVGVVDGVVVLEAPLLASVGVRKWGPSFVGRCVHCYVDYLSRDDMRKCPRCGGKIRRVYGKWTRDLPTDLRMIRYKANDELKIMKPTPPRVINVEVPR